MNQPLNSLLIKDDPVLYLLKTWFEGKQKGESNPLSDELLMTLSESFKLPEDLLSNQERAVLQIKIQQTPEEKYKPLSYQNELKNKVQSLVSLLLANISLDLSKTNEILWQKLTEEQQKEIVELKFYTNLKMSSKDFGELLFKLLDSKQIYGN